MAVEIVGARAPEQRSRHRRPSPALPRARAGDDGTYTAAWPAWGTTAHVTVTAPGLLPAARRIVAKQVAAAERAAARDRPDAEIHRLYRAGGHPITISPLLAELVSAALVAAERSGGDVDPTVAAAVTRAAAARRDLSRFPACGSTVTRERPAPGYESVGLSGRRLHLPAGVTLDLSATARAVTCDRAAATVHDRLGTGVLVGLGADTAAAGPAAADGWVVTLTEPGVPQPVRVRIPAGSALAGRTAGRFVDPRTGRAPLPVWSSAAAIGFTALEAATWAAAALVRGSSARDWLSRSGIPARLVTLTGDVITAGPWAAHETTAADPASAADPTRTTAR